MKKAVLSLLGQIKVPSSQYRAFDEYFSNRANEE
jgi:hypothetical protein